MDIPGASEILMHRRRGTSPSTLSSMVMDHGQLTLVVGDLGEPAQPCYSAACRSTSSMQSDALPPRRGR